MRSQDLTAAVPAIFRRTERFGYALLSSCFNPCQIVCILSEMSRTLHLLFHWINSSWQLLGAGNSYIVYFDDVINGHISFSGNWWNQSLRNHNSFLVFGETHTNHVYQVNKKWQAHILAIIVERYVRLWIFFGAVGEQHFVACSVRYWLGKPFPLSTQSNKKNTPSNRRFEWKWDLTTSNKLRPGPCIFLVGPHK